MDPAKIDPFADLMPSANNASIDAMFGLPGGSDAGDPLARFASDLPARGQAPKEGGVSTDPMAMFGAPTPPAAAPAQPVMRDHTPDINAAFVPPQWSDPLAAPPRAEPANIIPADVTWLKPKPRATAPASAPAAVAPPSPVAPPPPPPPPAPPVAAVAPMAEAAAPDFDLDDFMAMAAPAKAQGAAPSPVGSGSPFDSLAFEALAPAEPIAPPAVIPNVVEVPAPHAAPAVQAAPMAPPAVSLPASATAPADADALWQAFCEGAGAPIHLNRPLDAETMKVLGHLLHASIAGTLQLVAVRAATKQELRADVTMIQARANNPLKFTPDAHAALEQLVNPAMRGFMNGPAAMTDAMNDLVGHAIGTMAGMRAALDGVLERFAPAELEGKLTSKSVLDSLLPMNRRARLWDLYLQHFATIREEAQEDFQSLFGKAFLAAYEQQLDRLRQSGGPE
jgi:FHA domain-containing protein